MLLGTWELPADEAGRLALPPAFAAAAASGLTVTRGFDRCLHAFPRSSWNELAGRLSALPLGVEAARHVRRQIFGAAAPLVLTDDRLLAIPRPLLAYAELGTSAVLVGMDSYFEIWSPQLWQASDEQLTLAAATWRSSALPAALAAI